MTSEKTSLKDMLQAIISFQEELAKLYEQAAKEVCYRQDFQLFRQLTSKSEQHATELKTLLAHQSADKKIQVDNKQGAWQSAGLDNAGYDEITLIKIATIAEEKLIGRYKTLLDTPDLPDSIRNVFKRQLEFSQQSHHFLQNLL